MARGRKPLPTWRHRLAGNPGKRRLNDKERKPTCDLTDAPKWMSESQKQGWTYAIESAAEDL